MPSVKRIRFDDRQSVADRLHSASIDILPANIAEHSAVKWVLSYDSLCRTRPGERERSWQREPEEYGPTAIVLRLAADSLQPRIRFYFASLFHIARLKEVSSYSRFNIDRLLAPENLAPSTRGLARVLSVAGERLATSHDRDAEGILRVLAGATVERAVEQQRLAEEWWSLWTQETEPLQNAAQRLEEAWREVQGRRSERVGRVSAPAMTLIAACQRPSRLHAAMQQAGIRFKDASISVEPGFYGLGPLVVVLLASLSQGGDIEGGSRELEYLVREWIHLENQRLQNEERQRIQPQIDIALKVLERRYGTENPFDEYLPLNRSATPELRSLVQEHRLPDGTASPWLRSWENRLEDMPGYHGPIPRPTARGSGKGSVAWALRTADSAIKRHIVERPRPTEDWSDLVQRLYEQHYVKLLGEGAGRANEIAGKVFEVWSVDDFVEFVQQVTDGLNSYGYALRAPSRTRLETLLTKATKGESLWQSDSW